MKRSDIIEFANITRKRKFFTPRIVGVIVLDICVLDMKIEDVKKNSFRLTEIVTHARWSRQ
jgi:hypothetical protein